MFDIFNNREIATGIWVLIFIILFSFSKSIRKSFGGVVSALTKFSLLLFVLYMFVYIVAIIYFFYYIKLWDISLLKDTIFWSIGGAFVMLMNSNKGFEERGFFKSIIIDSIKLIVILEFIIALHPFSLLWELILQIVILFIVLINTTAKYSEKDIQVYKSTNVMLSIIGLTYLTISLIKTIKYIDDFFSFDTLRSFLFGPVLTILYIPFIYFSVLYMKYEIYFVQISFRFDEKKKLKKYVKCKIFKYCRLNLTKLIKLSKEVPLYKFDSIDDINLILNKRNNKTTK